ncbi:hypothetical protein [Streptomyces sp. SID5643]|uniref:hypothetical protein n=1 Tax=Streptomyces sp. SID5643 TaxID=2690307 RepID=UPI001370A3C9|nr:hypothetical protein [Streptomyces sp. SID5643]MZF83677.1 hypothetical protein [Streptomyces sp. SID5643]
MALVLCAFLHGVPEERHESVSVPAAFSATAADKDPHGPHTPHGAEGCAADVLVRTAAQPAEELALCAMAVVLLAVSVVAGRPLVRLVRRERRRRRSARTGRVALARTSRWRI